jgi:hypothetical protein
MANQEDSSDSTLRAMPELSMPQLAYEVEKSNWSRNHGPALIATAIFVLIVGLAVIFFNTSEIVDNSRPLVPDDFVPDGSVEIPLPDDELEASDNLDDQPTKGANPQTDSEKQD